MQYYLRFVLLNIGTLILVAHSLPTIAQINETIVENTLDNHFKTAKDIYIINTIQDLINIAQDVSTLSKQYKLAADLDLSESQVWEGGKGFKPIGTNSMPFTGSFDGDGHKITGLYINRPDENDVGLFGVIAPEAEIKNLAVEDAYIVGNENVGIVVGRNKGEVRKSYAIGEVSGNRAVGTFIGQNLGKITNSFAMGFVRGDTWIGGLVGRNEGGILNRTYFAGKVLGYIYFGGLVGTNNSGKISYSYWDKEVSGLPISQGGSGKSTTEMFTQSTYQNWNFDLVWAINEGLNYPYLQVLGEVNYPEPSIIEIDSIEQISKIGLERDFPWYGNYLLTSDISFIQEEESKEDIILTPIPSFNGTFDGNGFAILDLQIGDDEADYVGLFSHLFYGGKIQNLLVENCEVKGDYIVGGLVAFNQGGTIEKCKVNGIVSGNYKTGGIVGWNYRGTISQCFSEGILSTIDEGGGVVGVNDAFIYNCHSSMNIDGLFSLGGFSGFNSGSIEYCYSIGKVSGYTNVGGFNGRQDKGKFVSCYWDRETSGITTSAGGIGRTTAQMKLKETYYQWDFSYIWYIKSGETYPILRWTGNYPEEGEGTLEGEGITEGEGAIEGEGTIEGTAEGEVEGSVEGVVEGTTEGSPTEGQIEGTHEGQIEGGTTEGSLEGEGEGAPQPPEKKCGCFDNNKNDSPSKLLLDFIFIGLVISLATAVKTKK